MAKFCACSLHYFNSILIPTLKYIMCPYAKQIYNSAGAVAPCVMNWNYSMTYYNNVVLREFCGCLLL